MMPSRAVLLIICRVSEYEIGGDGGEEPVDLDYEVCDTVAIFIRATLQSSKSWSIRAFIICIRNTIIITI